jgi:hypothetical protein
LQILSQRREHISNKTLAKVERENAELRTKVELIESANKWMAVTPVIGKAIYGATIVGVAYYIYRIFDALAGKTTLTYIFTSLLANITITASIAVSLALTGLGYGLYQKRQRKKTTERLHKRIKELETYFDENRSTSGLTTRGDTNPVDR